MNRRNKKENAITLIALVVTIVVLLILASVSIAMLAGEKGIATQAQEAKENNERGRIIEDVKLAYNKVTIDKLGVQDISTMRDLTIIELKKQGYEIKDITTTKETITEINLSTETLTLNAGGEEGILTIEYQEENTSDSKYYIKVETKYYELTINPGDIELAEEATDVESLETEVKENIEITSSDTAETIIKIETVGNTITVTPIGEGTATITVTNGNITKQCTITVEDNSPTAITINGEDSVEVYKTITLSAEFDKGTGDIEWTSSNTDVATIDSNGVVTGVCCATETTTTITATYAENNTVAATKEITVTPQYVGECWKATTTEYYIKPCYEGITTGTLCSECGGKEVAVDQEVLMYESWRCDNLECEYYITNYTNYEVDRFNVPSNQCCPYCQTMLTYLFQMDYVFSCGHYINNYNGLNYIDMYDIDCPYCDGGKTYDYGEGVPEHY